ncbi:hypothetical protein [Paracoccus saliphilus]|uniref:Uncharacterized protein n=1 Tax=Paracoccus saliphilus TaxID=405559 RepID=A0AA45W271_9RHOB|nr:hypothetical protein [Paracoccus saliphilus]WCR01874.1 hypothetical protein JHX88_13195 [Paracoccus saliphilus]SIS64475.1 hypothetical protein SAMN05421772_102231 [Paracoccus saliphilus]
MSESTENHTLRLLQEMRKEMNEMRQEMSERFDGVDTRIDGVTHILTLLAANKHSHDDRITALEEKP